MDIAPSEEEGGASMTGLRICVGDDNEDFRQLLKLLLKTLGHEVISEASDGQALVTIATPDNVDLVIADFEMPGLDGLAAAEQIVQRHMLPIILLSGHEDVEKVVLEHEPVTLKLRKPVTLDTLADAIERAMQRKAAPYDHPPHDSEGDGVSTRLPNVIRPSPDR
jgi:response regulator NasT